MAKAWYELIPGTAPCIEANFVYTSNVAAACPTSNNFVCAVYSNYITGQVNPVFSTNIASYCAASQGFGIPSVNPSYLRKRPTA